MKHFAILLLSVSLCSCHWVAEKVQEEIQPSSDTLTVELLTASKKADTLLNSADYLILGNTSGQVKIVHEQHIDDYPAFDVLIGYGDDVILGKNLEYDDVIIYKKYSPQSSFEDYPATIYEGKLADPDFSTHPDAKRFVTRIKKGCEEGINFAGHYSLITWGCGSPCQSGVIVDRKTGHIYDGYGTSLGAAFRIDSKMIIRNVGAIDTATNLIKICAYCHVNHVVWNGTTFIEVN